MLIVYSITNRNEQGGSFVEGYAQWTLSKDHIVKEKVVS